jgi:hypothetical protein
MADPAELEGDAEKIVTGNYKVITKKIEHRFTTI